MEDIASSSQIHEHSLRATLLIGFLLLFIPCFSQRTLHTSDKKAIKLYEKSDELIKARDFEKGIDLLKNAIARDENFAEAYVRLAGTYNYLGSTDKAFEYYQSYFRVIPKADISPGVARRLTIMHFTRGYYRQAQEVFQFFIAAQEGKSLKKADSLLFKSIEYSVKATKNPVQREIQRLSDSVNRFAVQYFPVLTIDQQMIVYTKRSGVALHFDEDIVFARKTGDGWSAARGIDPIINTQINEGACSISADGRMLIFTSCRGRRSFGSCDLYYTMRSGDEWSKPRNMGKTVNSSSWDSQPSLSADGKTLYFSSNRPGGRGKKDIWVTLQVNGEWTTPTNLGREINTPQDDTTPFIHVNGKSLFFASNGHVGLGRSDLYVTEWETERWSQPRNLGYPINDFEDQSGLFITADGKKAYYTDEFNFRSAIFTFDIQTDTLISSKTSYLTGTITDAETGLPLNAQLELYDLNTQEKLYNTSSDPVNGNYFLALNEGGEFGAYARAKGYLFEDFRFDLLATSNLDPDTIDIALSPLQKGGTLVLENIYFNLDSYELLPKSQSELDLAFQFLKNNPEVKVEIGGHTDSSGTSDYNLDLSERRARAVYDHLLKKGISEAQMVYKGYGSAFPADQHQSTTSDSSDRRIEFRILSTLVE